MCESYAQEVQKRESEPLQLELQEVRSSPKWVLGIRHWGLEGQ